ncbi:nuclear pore complex protein Nup153 isoform X2 [Uranotaenia lowii]|uniref:nuclear pore complex protein Nup153 isoform X2 n=1 Tax=Uranotaenia lowii TaxID=190385 RepID=UPI00247A8829|nr:nuclear pore complex protein Nup153 isoform X2 [Uranotaenia lowii]
MFRDLRRTESGNPAASPATISIPSLSSSMAATTASASGTPLMNTSGSAESPQQQQQQQPHNNLEDDPNTSIINRVRSRVSSILPDTLSKWFSPLGSKRARDDRDRLNRSSGSSSTSSGGSGSPSTGTPTAGRNGNLPLKSRRLVNSNDGNQSDDFGQAVEEEEDEQGEHAPPFRKKKRLEEGFNTSLIGIQGELLPGPSGLNISAIDRRASLPGGLLSGATSARQSGGVQNRFSSSTPSTSPQQKEPFGGIGEKLNRGNLSSSINYTKRVTAAPYNFGAGPAVAENVSLMGIREEDGPNQESSGHQNESFSSSIRHRKSIREVSGRKRLNIPSMSVDRSTSEPPVVGFSGATSLFGRANQQLHPVQQSSSEDLTEDVQQGDAISNGNLNESASENSSVSNLNLSQTEQTDGRRLTGFMGNSRSKRLRVGGSTGDLCFSSHLETEKSLFSAKNNSRSGRPIFNASLYGSTLSLGSNHSSLFSNSPFYNGKTMYGGASAYSARRDNHKKALRVPVQIRPSSSLSNFSSSNNSLASDTSALSNTAKRILEIMNQCSGPLNEARKLGSSLSLNSTLASSKVPGLVQARKRFNEEDITINRSIRMSSPRTPYSRPQSATGSAATLNKPPICELQIPSMSQLLHMKRLQSNTESVRRMATESTGSTALNEPSEYRLPENASSSVSNSDDRNNNVKHTNKIRNKLTRVREEPADRSNNTPVPQINLPDVQLSGLKSVPKFDIKLPTSSGATSNNRSTGTKANIFTSEGQSSKLSSSQAENSHSLKTDPALPNSTVYKFSAPSKLNLPDSQTASTSGKAVGSFKFSDPEPIGTKTPLAPKLGGFQFNPDLAKPKVAPVSNEPLTIATKTPPTLKTGSCLDALKGEPSVPELKTGSCLDALAKPAVTSTTGFGNAFKLTGSNKWECEACMVRNDPEKTSCVACTTPKPGAKPSVSETPKTNISLDTKPTPASDSGFKALIAQQSARWECSDCLTRNDADKLKCLCCEKPKPGTSSATSKPVQSAVVPDAIKSMFAMPSLPATSAASDQGFKALVAQQSANRWECSACMTRNEASRSKCACCEQAKPGSNASDTPSFSFGSKTAPSTNSGQFAFGVPSGTSATTEPPKATGFTFGGSPAKSASIATPSGGFSFGTLNNTTKTEQKTGFTFGSTSTPATSTTVTTGFSFGAKPTDTTDSTKPTTKDESKTEETKPASFKFGSTGGFSFGTKTADTSESNNANKIESTTNKPAAPTGFTFGSSKPAESTATSGFSFAKSDETAPASSVSTNPSKTVESSSSGTTSTIASQPSATFGSLVSGSTTFGGFAGAAKLTPKTAGAENTAEKATSNNSSVGVSGGFSFGSSKPTVEAAPISGSDKKDTAVAPSVPIFGGIQKQTGPSITPSFSFGSATAVGTSSATGSTASTLASSSFLSTTTTTTSMAAPTFSFGAGAPKTVESITSSSVPNTSGFVFGQANQSASTPSFGAAAAEKPTFGSFAAGSTASSGAASSSIFGGATGGTSTDFAFGGTAKPPAEVTSTSSAFTFGANKATTPTVVGNAPVFGTPPTTTAVKPVFGSAGGPSTFGGFGSGNTAASNSAGASPAFGSNVFGSNSTQTGSIFGQTTPSPSFGTAPAFGSASFGGSAQTASPFGGSSAATTASSDGPLPKKAFDFTSGANVNSQSPAPFQFGTNNNNDGGSKPFSFSASATPSFNFSAGSNTAQSSAPFTFGSGSSLPAQSLVPSAVPRMGCPGGGAAVFNFGGGGIGAMNEQGVAPVPSAAPAFQFGAAPVPVPVPGSGVPNPFAATSIAGQQQQQQRRKLRATRRTVPR